MIEVEKLITISKSKFSLALWDSPDDPGKGEYDKIRQYTIAIGAKGFNTPSGVYRIVNKIVNPSWTMPNSEWVPEELRGTTIPGGEPNNPLKARWMGFSPYEGVGIHGTGDTDSLGSAASHGCIRMSPKDVKDLYERVPLGTPVVIQ